MTLILKSTQARCGVVCKNLVQMKRGTNFFQALNNNFTITNFTSYQNDKFSCPNGNFEEDKYLFNETWAKEIIEKTSQYTKIYVFFGTKYCLRSFMGQMSKTGLFSDSEMEKNPYLVVYVETNVENPDLFEYLWDRSESHPRYVNNCAEIVEKNGTRDRWNQWESLIVVTVSK